MSQVETAPARRSPLVFLAPLIIFGVLAVVFGVGLFSGDKSKVPSALIGRVAPAITLAPLEGLQRDGKPVPAFGNADLAGGRATLVNVWASWCAPCRVEHPHLMALAAEGVPVYGVNYKDEPAKALAFLAEMGNPYRAVGADASGRMGIDWGLYGVPETFVIDGEGRVVTRFAGPITERALAESIRPAMEKAAAAD